VAVRTRLAHARALPRGPAPQRRRAVPLLEAAEAAATRLGMAGALAEAAAPRTRSHWTPTHEVHRLIPRRSLRGRVRAIVATA